MTTKSQEVLEIPTSLLLIVVLAITACRDAVEDRADLALVTTEVEAGVWAFHAADTAMDADGVIALLWPEFTMLADGERTSYDDVVAGSRAFMSSLRLFHAEWTDLMITPLGPYAAVSSFRFRDSIITRSGDLIQSRGPTTFVWQRRGDEWRVIAADSDHYPIDP